MTSSLTWHRHSDNMRCKVESRRGHLEGSVGLGSGVFGSDGVFLAQSLVAQTVHDDVDPVIYDVTGLPGVTAEICDVSGEKACAVQ